MLPPSNEQVEAIAAKYGLSEAENTLFLMAIAALLEQFNELAIWIPGAIEAARADFKQAITAMSNQGRSAVLEYLRYYFEI